MVKAGFHHVIWVCSVFLGHVCQNVKGDHSNYCLKRNVDLDFLQGCEKMYLNR